MSGGDKKGQFLQVDLQNHLNASYFNKWIWYLGGNTKNRTQISSFVETRRGKSFKKVENPSVWLSKPSKPFKSYYISINGFVNITKK